MRDDVADDATTGMPAGYAPALLTLLALAAAISILFWPHKAQQVEVRFCNSTSEALRTLVSHGTAFGDIAPGACSAYRTLDGIYPEPGFTVNVDGNRTYVGPEDHVGGTVLPRGRYEFTVERAQWGLRTQVHPKPTQ